MHLNYDELTRQREEADRKAKESMLTQMEERGRKREEAAGLMKNSEASQLAGNY